MSYSKKKKIFIHASSGGLGDVIMLLPCIVELLKDPAIEITITISYKALIEVLDYYLGDNSQSVTYHVVPAASSATEMLRFFFKLKSKRFDLVYFPTVSNKVKASIALLALNPRQAVKSISALFCKPQKSEHKISYFSRRVGLTAQNINFRKMNYNLQEKSRLLNSKSAMPLKKNHFVAVAPGSSQLEQHKRWTQSKYEDLIVQLHESLALDVVLLGGDDEHNLLEDILKRCRSRGIKCTIARPKSILESISILNSVKFLVSGCCSAIHMGSLTGVKIIGLYGPTDFEYTGPWNDNFSIKSIDLDCAPCYSDTPLGCGNPVCMDGIKTESIFRTISLINSQ